MYAMPSGYCHELDSRKPWEYAADSKWDTEVYSASGNEVYQGSRLIDDSLHAVFWCPDGVYRAVLKHCCKPL